jgi:hypothetical protein
MAELIYDPREDRGSAKGKVGMTKLCNDPGAAEMRGGIVKWRMAEAETQTAKTDRASADMAGSRPRLPTPNSGIDSHENTHCPTGAAEANPDETNSSSSASGLSCLRGTQVRLRIS